VRSWVLQALEQCTQQAKQSSTAGAITSPIGIFHYKFKFKFKKLNFGFIESQAYTLLYGKFRLHADKMKHLMSDIEIRRDKGPE